jgi:membrane protease YdiL (CAAX protease family)
MDGIAQGLIQGVLFVGVIGLAGLPFFVWRRPPVYYWRCPRCRSRNPVEASECAHCQRAFSPEDRTNAARADWKPLDLLAVYAAASIAGPAVGLLALAIMGRLPFDLQSAPEARLLESPDARWLLELFTSLLFAVLCIWLLNGRHRWPLSEVGLHLHDAGRWAAIGVGVGLVAFAVGELYEMAAGRVPFLREEQQRIAGLFPTRWNDPLWVLIVPILLVLNPLGFELFFRGMLYRLLRARWTATPAMWLSACVFAVSGGSLVAFSPFLLLGAVNALLYERTRSLVPGIVASSVQATATIGWIALRDLSTLS